MGPSLEINLTTIYAVEASKGSILAKRMGARQWLTWKNAIISPVAKWTLDLTTIKTSQPGVNPATLKVIRAVYTAGGDKFTPLTASEAETLRAQNPIP